MKAGSKDSVVKLAPLLLRQLSGVKVRKEGKEMANWVHRLELKDLHDKYDKEGITPNELGVEVAKRIRTLLELNTPPIPEELRNEAKDIALEFESMVDDDIDEYDSILSKLYDWADTTLPNAPNTPFHAIPKLCWINTF